MDTVFVVVCLGVFGVILGSFAGASVWRLRARQLVADKKDKQPYDKAEYQRLVPLTKSTLKNDRSRCLHCGHELQAIDLVPLISWLSTRGRCRYCHTRIGVFEPVIELGLAAALIVVYLLWPYPLIGTIDIIHLGLWLLAVVPLAILFAYDLKWFLLPNSIVSVVIAVGVFVTAIAVVSAEHPGRALVSVIAAIGILSGIYALLWLLSQGKWIGFGDVKLGLGLALLLANWQLAFIALFAANFIGCLLVIPGMLRGTVGRTTEVQFGPLLIIGAVVALVAGQPIIDWYSQLL